MHNINSSRALVSRLKSALMKKRLLLFFSGLITTGAVLIAVSIILSLVALIVVLPVALKISLLVVSGLVTVYIFSRYACKHFFDGDVDTIAVELEKKHPELKGILIAAVQFSRQKLIPGYSGDLIDATISSALKKAGNLNFNETISFYPVLKTGRYLAVSALLALLLLVIVPGLFSYSYEVYSNATSVVSPPLGYDLVGNPGSTEWVKYRDIRIGGSLFGDKLPKEAKIYHRLAGGSWQETDVDLRKETVSSSDRGDSLSFGMTLRQINKSFDYYVEAGRVKSEVYQVNVVDRPRVSEMKLSIFYPEYTKLPPTVINENNGSFSALVGSRVNLKIEANLPVQSAELVFADKSEVPLKVNHTTGETSLVVGSSQSYHVRLTDHLGEKNPDPIEYYITAIADEFPSIDVVRPGFDVNLSDELILPLKVNIFDDYGFTSLVMKYQIVNQGRASNENVAVIHYSDRITTEGEVEFNWDIDQLNLFPGDYVIYSFEVADNDMISGPKISKSRKFIARLPSLEEIVAQTEQQQKQRITDTEKILKSGKELANRLKNVSRKLEAESKSGEKSSWQNQKELEAITDQNMEMVKELEKIAEEMEKSVDELNENSLMSREILEKMQQLQKLYEEIATPEMKEAQKKLMEALKSMDQKELDDAMKQFQMSQEEMLKRIERSIALLKKMQLEQKMEAMVRKAEELARQQEEMNEKTESSENSDLPQLSSQEDAVREKLESLKEELKDMNSMAEEADLSDLPELQKFKEAVEKTDAEKNMSQMSQAMNKKEKQKAGEEGEKSHSKLMDMLNQMQQQLMAMQGGDKEKIEKALKAAIDDSNYLSKNQEQLMSEAAAMQTQSMMMRELATQQQDLLSSCSGLKNRITELGKESPFLAMELDKLMESTFKEMEMAMNQFDEKKQSSAMQNQREAMANLNKASQRLMESLNQQKECNSGSSCDKNTGKMQQLTEKQNKLNQQTQSECNNPNGSNPKPGEGQGGREALKRLASEQGAIRKSVEELSREFGNSRQILGRLDGIADEMKQVEEALAEGQTGPDITERQLKIFSRMLEASRSLYKKDFSEQRQSKSASSSLMYIPPGLSSDILENNLKLEDRLRQYLGDDYPKQYEEQIKAYFKALLKTEQQNGN